MSEISYWHEEFRKAVDEYEELVEKLECRMESTGSASMTENTMKTCDEQYLKVLGIKKSCGLELKLVKDRTIKAEFEVKAKALEHQISETRQKHEDIKNQSEKNTLMEKSRGPVVTKGRGNDDLLDEAHKIQDLTMESLERTKAMVEQSKEVATDTLTQLEDQKQQVLDVEKEIDIMDSNLTRAEKLIMNFTRRMAADGVFRTFCAVNIVILFALILYCAISKKALTVGAHQSSSSGTGPSVRTFAYPTMSPTATPTHH